MLVDGPSAPVQKGTYKYDYSHVHSYQLFHDGLLVHVVHLCTQTLV